MLEFINSYIFGPGLCVAVFGFGIFLLVYLKGFFLVKPGKVFGALKSEGENGMSPIKAMTLALAGTLGVGNIAGVASAIAIGGPGAVFWMLISVVAALPIKYAETVLAMGHRRKDSGGKLHGGAYFYMNDRSSSLSRAFAAVFAFLCVAASLAMGCTIQANAISVSMEQSFGIPTLLSGLVMALIILFVASGGLERISFVTSRLIPIMSGTYIAMSMFIVFTNIGMLGDIVLDILGNAFSSEAVGGGVIGFITSRAVRIGVTRGIVSNEAGCGTAPIAHACANTKSPAAQGVFGMAEVFIDTVVICTLTAFSVLIAERHGVALNTDGMISAVASYARFIPFAAPIMAISVLVFAFCTMVCWFFYGSESLAYLTKNKRAPVFNGLYLCIYSLCTLIGAVSSGEWLWGLSDLVISVMTAVNIAVLLLSCREIKAETDAYFFAPGRKKKKQDTKFK